jgi:hypothetical protein
MKQTAVEWLAEQLFELKYPTLNQIEIIQQAKEMEKQQIIDAWIAEDNPLQRLKAEQYYNETFS